MTNRYMPKQALQLTESGLEELVLDARRAIFIKDIELLVLSDIHLGKSGYFQKFGAAIPAHHHQADLARLEELIRDYDPKKVLINGDLFHAGITKDVSMFSDWINSLKEKKTLIQFILVRGNHDPKPFNYYKSLGFEHVYDSLIELEYGFVHQSEHIERLLGGPMQPKIFFYGHVHAGIELKGKGRQKVRQAAFAIEETDETIHVYLPAFGRLTGIKTLDKKKGRTFYLPTEEHVFKL